MKNYLLTSTLVLWTFCLSWSQSADLDQIVSFDYDNVRLENALNDISNTYGINFSYSKYFVPVDTRINVSVVEAPLSVALEELFITTQIVYMPIGGQVVLNVDDQKIRKPSKKDTRIGSVTEKAVQPQTQNIYIPEPVEEPVLTTIEIDDTTESPFEEDAISSVEPYFVSEKIYPIRSKKPNVITIPEKTIIEDLDIEQFDVPEQKAPDFKAQISLMPKIGASTRKGKNEEVENNASVNIFFGSNDGVNGLEIGGFGNIIKNDVKGCQIAGLGNAVGGDVNGLQIAGLTNFNRGSTMGNQFAGITNITKQAYANQFAGIANVIRGDASRLKVAGIVNYVDGNAPNSVQIAGICNASTGDTKFQFAGISNVAKNVSGGQISSILNKATYVDGFQAGLINICDSISGTPFGLISIVKHGENSYNRIELGGGNALHTSVALKLGTKNFYNIFRIGGRFEGPRAWGLGYGIGYAKSFNYKWLINTELTAMHINENESWTSKLNLLSQLHITIDYRITRRISIFAGPALNVMTSNLYASDSNTYGTTINTDVLFEKNFNNNNNRSTVTNVKGWIGFNAGIRF